METIFYVLLQSSGLLHDKMSRFDEEKTFADYMIWQLEFRNAIELEFGATVVMNFDIKYRKVTN